MQEVISYLSSIELLGLIATVITLCSFSIKYSLQFRQVNIVAALLWVTYGVSILSAAVAITNSMIVAMHLYHLYNHYFRNIPLESKPVK